MNRTEYLAVVAVFVLVAMAAGAPGGTQAGEVGDGIEIQVSDGPNGQYAVLDQETDGVRIALTDSNTPVGGGEGVNARTITRFNNVFSIQNTNDDQRAFVYVTDETDAITFYTQSGGTYTTIEGQENERALGVGKQLQVGFAVDSNELVGQDEGLDATLRVVARVGELADAVLDIVPQSVAADESVTFDASGSAGDDLTYDYSFSDGDVRENAGPQTERSLSDPGTYEVNLTVTETSGAGDDTSAFVVREFVVVGEGSSEELDADDETTIDHPEENTTGVVVRTGIEFEAEIDGTVASETVANESIDDLVGEFPDNESIGATDITVPSEQEDTDATVRLDVSRSEIPSGASPSDLIIERYNESIDEWEALPTSVNKTLTGPDIVSLEGETPGFSVFAVAVRDDDEDDEDDEDDIAPVGSGGGGGGALLTPTPAPGETPTPAPGETPSELTTETPAPGQTPSEPTTETPAPGETPAVATTDTPAATPTEAGPTATPTSTPQTTTPEEAGPTATPTSTPAVGPGEFVGVNGITAAAFLAVVAGVLLARRYLSVRNEEKDP